MFDAGPEKRKGRFKRGSAGAGAVRSLVIAEGFPIHAALASRLGVPRSLDFMQRQSSRERHVELTHRIASLSISRTFAPNSTSFEGELALGSLDMPFAIPNVKADARKAPAHTRVLWYRSVSNSPHAFASGGFMGELAQRDPVQYLIDALGGDREHAMTATGALKPVDNFGAKWEERANDTSRNRGVLERVAKESGLATALPRDEGVGSRCINHSLRTSSPPSASRSRRTSVCQCPAWTSRWTAGSRRIPIASDHSAKAR